MSITTWKQTDVEGQLRTAISIDESGAPIEWLTTLVRLSGSTDERRAALAVGARWSRRHGDLGRDESGSMSRSEGYHEG